jgi:hypothetical protein
MLRAGWELPPAGCVVEVKTWAAVILMTLETKNRSADDNELIL